MTRGGWRRERTMKVFNLRLMEWFDNEVVVLRFFLVNRSWRRFHVSEKENYKYLKHLSFFPVLCKKIKRSTERERGDLMMFLIKIELLKRMEMGFIMCVSSEQHHQRELTPLLPASSYSSSSYQHSNVCTHISHSMHVSLACMLQQPQLTQHHH